MSSEKKVLLLFLALIGFIVFCVYTHLPQFMEKQNEVIINEPTKIENVEPKEEVISKVEETTDEIKNENDLESSTKTNEIQEGESLDEPKKVEETIEEEPVVEEPVEPLITTDKRYKREGTESNIEDLSIDAQELQIKINEFVKSNPIIFKRASYRITKKSNKTINQIVKDLEEFPNIKIEVAGHTDAIGAANINQQISLARAKSVRKKLIALGISKDRIIARGYGEDIPLVKNSPKGYSKINRRVEFNIIEE